MNAKAPIQPLIALVCSIVVSGLYTADAGDPKPGKYKGNAGVSGRISFKVDKKGRKLSALNISMFALGVDTFQEVTDYEFLASATDGRKFRISKSGRFTATGQDSNEIEYTVTGKLKGKNKFVGTVVMEKFQIDRYLDDPVLGFVPIYETVSGSQNYKAKN